MKKLIEFLKPYKILLFIGPLFKLFEAILELMLPLLMSKIIDIGVAHGDKQYVIHTGLLMIAIAIIGVLCAFVCQYSASIVSQGTGTKMRNALFEHIGTLANKEIDTYGTASLVNRITNDVNQVQLGVAMFIRLVIRAPFLCIGGLIMAFTIDAKLSIILLIVLPIFIAILMLTMKKTVPLYKNVQVKLDIIARRLRENLSGVRVVRAFSKEKYEETKFEEANSSYEKNAVLVGKISALLNPLTNLVMNFGIGAILWFGGIRVNGGQTSTGEVIAFIGYVTQILAALIVISNLVVIYTKAFASLGRIVEIFNTKTSIENATITKEIKEYNIAVEFKNVSMKYEDDGDYDIKEISFQVKKGETIGIIGGTGSGKSTIVNLIPRFYDATNGEVLVFGENVKEYSLEDLRDVIGIVPQKTVLFTGSIRENIMWGKANASLEEVMNAAKVAQAEEFIKRLPEGYDTPIRRGGVNVSGGQRQRLTIARALIKKPPILILDDSFNALDYLTDKNLRNSLKEELSDMTTFIVSQRASTIKDANQIIVLADGEMAGIGTHNDLMKSCEVYREICQSQESENEVKQ